jgi:hypothetical protein
MTRTFIIILVVLALTTAIGQFIPDRITADIDAALVYFLTFLYQLDHFLDVRVLLICLQIIFNFLTGVATFWVFHASLRMTNAAK